MSDLFSDPYAEVEVIGSLLEDPHAGMVIARGNDLVRPNDFRTAAHRVIAEAIWTLDDNDRTITTTSLASQLRQNNLLNEVGGLAYLQELQGYAGSLEDAAARVVKTAMRRELHGLGGIIQTLAAREGTQIETMFEKVEDHLYNIRTRGQGKLRTIGDLIPEWYESIQNGGSGYNFGIDWFDDLKQRVDLNDFNIIAGRPGDGKTSFLRYLAYKLAIVPPPAERKGVYIGDFEEGSAQWVAKLLALMTGINSVAIAHGTLSEPEQETVDQHLGILRGAPLVIDSTSGLTVGAYRDRVRAAQRLFERKFGVEMGFHAADYIQRMKGPESNSVTKVTNISNGLRDMCQPNELNVPSFSTAQLSRAPVQEGRVREYRISDLRESGTLEQDATSVIFITRDWLINRPSQTQVNGFPENATRDPDNEQWLAEVIRVKFAKNRGKPTGFSRRLAWRKWCGRYEAL